MGRGKVKQLITAALIVLTKPLPVNKKAFPFIVSNYACNVQTLPPFKTGRLLQLKFLCDSDSTHFIGCVFFYKIVRIVIFVLVFNSHFLRQRFASCANCQHKHELSRNHPSRARVAPVWVWISDMLTDGSRSCTQKRPFFTFEENPGISGPRIGASSAIYYSAKEEPCWLEVRGVGVGGGDCYAEQCLHIMSVDIKEALCCWDARGYCRQSPWWK